jgi:hypothetical protein
LQSLSILILNETVYLRIAETCSTINLASHPLNYPLTWSTPLNPISLKGEIYTPRIKHTPLASIGKVNIGEESL